MKKIPLYALPLLLSLHSGCSEKPNIEGFNSEIWKNDKKACQDKRSYFAEKLFENSKSLKGMDDDDVIELFGKPESSNWETRGKKTFYYYISPGSQCDENLILEGSKIVFEFDALGRVNLVTEKRF